MYVQFVLNIYDYVDTNKNNVFRWEHAIFCFVNLPANATFTRYISHVISGHLN